MTGRWHAIQHELEAELGEPITIDALTGGWQIAQRAAGHRHSADDVLTAYCALAHASAPGCVLDLGTGIGGVGLLMLWGLPAARLVCIEAQDISFRLLRANIAGNELGDRVEAHHGDLRSFESAQRFPLITGSPPYFPVGTGIVPADSQKAHARFELRGDVTDYARAAARLLADDGVFVFCFPTAQRQRALVAATDAGLAVTAYRDVIPRAGLRSLFTLFAARRRRPSVTEPSVKAPFTVRDNDGSLSAEMRAVRRGFGFAE
ncbi:MAG: tRNA1(Val) (adenine(37)-N6)-methyltransferase [Kofleriaceae bacterium]